MDRKWISWFLCRFTFHWTALKILAAEQRIVCRSVRRDEARAATRSPSRGNRVDRQVRSECAGNLYRTQRASLALPSRLLAPTDIEPPHWPLRLRIRNTRTANCAAVGTGCPPVGTEAAAERVHRCRDRWLPTPPPRALYRDTRFVEISVVFSQILLADNRLRSAVSTCRNEPMRLVLGLRQGKGLQVVRHRGSRWSGAAARRVGGQALSISCQADSTVRW